MEVMGSNPSLVPDRADRREDDERGRQGPRRLPLVRGVQELASEDRRREENVHPVSRLNQLQQTRPINWSKTICA